MNITTTSTNLDQNRLCHQEGNAAQFIDLPHSILTKISELCLDSKSALVFKNWTKAFLESRKTMRFTKANNLSASFFVKFPNIKVIYPTNSTLTELKTISEIECIPSDLMVKIGGVWGVAQGELAQALREFESWYDKESNRNKEGFERATNVQKYLSIQKDWRLFSYVPTEFEGFSAMALVAIRQHGIFLRHILPTTPNYSRFAFIAVLDDFRALKYVPPTTPGFHKIALQAFLSGRPSAYSDAAGEIFRAVPHDTTNYHEIARAAANLHCNALAHIPIKIKGYREVALSAVSKNGLALEYVSPKCTDYFEIAWAAIHQRFYALEHVPRSTSKYGELKAFADKKAEEYGEVMKSM